MSKDLGHGMYMMDVAPEDGCLQCGHWEWAFALTNTNLRVDLLTNERITNWTAKSECLHCGTTTVWNPNPDEAYPGIRDK